MVKSFQGVRMVEPKKSPATQILVKDHMSTNLVTFHPDDTIDKVLDVLTKRKISGAPVVDESGALIGIISEHERLVGLHSPSGVQNLANLSFDS